MNDWVYDLQRFAEGNAAEGAAADTPQAPAGQSVQEGAATSTGTPPAVEVHTEEGASDTPPAGGFAIQVDPVTGDRTLVQLTEEENEGTSVADEASQQTQEPPIAPTAYTANELLAALTTGRVDESRIPEELRPQYIAIRQQQQIAALTAQQQAMQMQPPQSPAAEGEQPQEGAELYRRIQEAAEKKAMKDFGIAPEQLSEMLYSDDPAETKKVEEFRVAVQMNVNAITREIDAYQMTLRQQQAEAQAFIQEFTPKMQQVQASEPNFNQIDVMMETYYRQLPYQEAVQVEAAIERYKNGTCTRADIPVLEGYYNKTRAAFYAKQTGLSPAPTPAPKATPPQVEGAGKVTPNAPDQVDWGAMRTMGVRERNEFLRAHLH
jgi:hypothetical protein|uniref:Uncharacterized protein n=1 Tax=Podoviridae sp. ctRkj24 TaxID=2823559 RepID=A0A8S5LB84_9CAUD|nr:MAG TPA: hypothetical protein [Podoviridae sp. ctRkj24]